MKGVSEVIAIILLLMITIAIAGLAYTFMSATMSETTSAASSAITTTTSSMLTSFTIESMSDNVAYVRNTGQSTLSNLSVYVNDLSVRFNMTPSSLTAGSVGSVAIIGYVKEGDTIKISTPSAFSAIKTAPVQCAGAAACWRFDEGSGTVAQDSSGNGYDGNLSRTAWTSGKYGSGLLFNGNNSSMLVTSNSALDAVFQTKGAVMMWVKTDFPSSFGAGTGRTFFNKAGNSSFQFYKHQNIADGPQLEIFHEGIYSKVSPAIPVWDNIRGNWTQFVLTWNWNNGTNKEMAIYYNGNLLSNAVTNTSIITPISNGNFTIGSFVGGGNPFNGTIDEVAIWNRVLSASEIANMYNMVAY